MKMLLLIVVVAIIVGCRSQSIRWKELGLIVGFIFFLIGWETFNIVFRYIGVE